jgi:hypothetical protein
LQAVRSADDRLMSKMESAMNGNRPEFAHDVLRGAEEIAEFLFGSREQRRKVYHLAATSNLPLFKLGATIYARRSVLLKWISFTDRWASMQFTGPAKSTDGRCDSNWASKTRFRCPMCNASAWGKPNLRIDCRRCDQPMLAF